MPFFSRLAFSALSCLVVAAKIVVAEPVHDEDMANERLRATPMQREQHWRIDCARLRAELLAAPLPAATAAELARWRESLALCAAIYNVPGNADALACPDYATAGRLLAAMTGGSVDPHEDDIPDMRILLRCDP